MKSYQGWFLPDADTHFSEYLKMCADKGKPIEYQKPHRDQAVALCAKRDVAVDVGAHVGLWSRPLSNMFGKVISFEPLQAFHEILLANAPNIDLQPYALGDRPGSVSFEMPADNSGMAHVTAGSEGAGNIEVRTLDSFQFPIVDFIKIDCEGYEYPVLKGAVETLRRCKPTIVVEQKPHAYFNKQWDQYAAVRYLQTDCGYKAVARIIDDWVLKPAP